MRKVIFFILTAMSPFVGTESKSAEDQVIELVPIKVHDDAPSTVTVDQEQNEQKQALDLEDVFRQTPEVRVGAARKSAEKIYVRGVEDRSLNVTVDGARQSGFLFYHQGRLNIDTDILKKIEVDAGTGNALSGPGALGGAIRFVTKDPEDILAGASVLGGLVKLGYATNNDEKTGSLAGAFKNAAGVSGLLYFNGSSSIDNFSGAGSRIPYTGGQPQGGLAKLIYQPNENHKFSLGATQRQNNGDRMVRSNFGYTVSQPVSQQKFEFNSYTLDYKYTSGLPSLNIEAELAEGDQFLENQTTTIGQAIAKNRSAMVRNRYDSKEWRWYLGVDFYDDIAEGWNSGKTRVQEEGRIVGFFTQATYKPFERWQFRGGARYDKYFLKTLNGKEYQDEGLSPNASVQYLIDKNFLMNISWAKAFKGTVSGQALSLAGATSATETIGFSPTEANTSEISFEYKPVARNIKWTAYRTHIVNPQLSDVVSGVITRSNMPAIESEGWSVRYLEEINSQWISNLSFSRSQVRADGQSVGSAGARTHNASASGDRVSLSFDYRLPEKFLIVSWSTLWVADLKDVPAGGVQQPGYDVHDLSMSWIPTGDLRLNVGLYNIFNKAYVAQGSVYQVASPLYEPGRDLRATLTHLF